MLERLSLGGEVPNTEAERIASLTPEEVTAEIEALVIKVEEDQQETLRAMLRLFYKHPERYQRVPSMEPKSPKVFPYTKE